MILSQLNVNFEDVFICVEGERVREKEVKWRVERHHVKPSTHRTYLPAKIKCQTSATSFCVIYRCQRDNCLTPRHGCERSRANYTLFESPQGKTSKRMRLLPRDKDT